MVLFPFGNQILFLIIDFVLDTSWWSSWVSLMSWSRSDAGMTRWVSFRSRLWSAFRESVFHAAKINKHILFIGCVLSCQRLMLTICVIACNVLSLAAAVCTSVYGIGNRGDTFFCYYFHFHWCCWEWLFPNSQPRTTVCGDSDWYPNDINITMFKHPHGC